MISFPSLLNKNGITFLLNENMAKHTSFKVGGSVKYFVSPKNYEELKIVLNGLNSRHLPYFILGNGTNVLFKQRPSVKAVISLKLLPRFCQRKGDKVYVCADYSLFELNKILKDEELGGLEFSFGIPASVGGAIKCNAGAFGKCICDFVENVTILNTKTLKMQKITRKTLKYGYRSTNISGVILWATFKFERSDFATISTLQNEYFSQRIAAQPYSQCSAGSVFKREGDVIPSKLIDEAGLKGLRIGGAMVSEKHAGFIVKAVPNCTSGDILKLIGIVKRKIKSRFNIDLKEEILIV